MEKGVTPEETLSWEEYLKESFSLPERDWEQYSPLTLAYIGDSVYDLLIRTVLVKRGNTQTARLHGGASRLVRAGAQARIAEKLLPHLTPQEEGVYRRGKNSKPAHTAKNADRREYLEATGFEALLGYLYLKGDYRRMIDLVKLGLEESGYGL